MSVLCVLPARLESERIPRKPLQMLAGRTLLEWTWRKARDVPAFDRVWVATDAEEIAEVVRSFGGRAVRTDPGHPSGTDRVAEAAGRETAQGYEIVVNFQADEPFADPAAVTQAVERVRAGAPVATLAAPVASEAEWRSEAVVKVVIDSDGRALYFSRAPIPHPRGGSPRLQEGGEARYLRHVGIYAFRREALARWVRLPAAPLERIERLEQLRALEAGIPIEVVVGPATEPGVDEPEDLARAERLLSSEPAVANPERERSA